MVLRTRDALPTELIGDVIYRWSALGGATYNYDSTSIRQPQPSDES